jgi:serine phosphatase RsbU (regulator of sigma subunit)
VSADADAGSDRGVVVSVGRPRGGHAPADLSSRPVSVAASAPELVRLVALRAAACVGAATSDLALLDHATGRLRVYHGDRRWRCASACEFLHSSTAEGYVEVPLTAPCPIAAAVRSGDSVFVTDLASGTRFPVTVDDTQVDVIDATACVPLFSVNGTAVGAIGFGWTEGTDFDARLVNALRAVARLCAELVERMEHHDEEHQLLLDIHSRFLDEVPVALGIETAAAYLPAGNDSAVGGDWFESLVFDDHRFAVAVGDVTGHGLAAVADMALIRGTISALLHAGLPVADIFPEISALFRSRSALLMATAAIGVIDCGSDLLTYATAGHPPPLLRDPTGAVRILDDANAPLLGIGLTRSVEGTAPFLPGSLLVMYTDGLVERRDRRSDQGTAAAAGVLRALPLDTSPDEVITALLDALIGSAPPSDDIAVVVLKRSR